MRENLLSLGVASVESGDKLQWIGGDRRLVFHGDILGDRTAGGFEILTAIQTLQEQAAMVGGAIDVIAGNHDDFLISFLAGRAGAGNADNLKTCEKGDYFGLLEAGWYGSEKLRTDLTQFNTLSESDRHQVWMTLSSERPQILEAMRTNPEGRKLLESICSMKLVTKQDDTLFVHTDPTEGMIQTLLSNPGYPIDRTIDAINHYYQEGLRAILIDGTEPNQYYAQLQDTFLDTNNRDIFRDLSLANQLRDQGINAIVHGHSDESWDSVKRGDLLITSVDMSSFKYGATSNKRSIARIQTNGIIERGAEHKAIRE